MFRYWEREGGEWGRLKISMAVFFELGEKIWQVFSSGCVA